MIDITVPLRNGTQRLSEVPWVFDGLRWLLEAGFGQHHQLIERHFSRSTDKSSQPADNTRVLDCGCGTGVMAQCFDPGSYTGIDLSPQYVQRARAKHPGYRFLAMDASALQFASDSFDAVIVAGVLHHMDDRLASSVLSELHRVLKPGGKLLMWEDVPTRGSLNLVGQLVHRLDVGDHIRDDVDYVRLLGSKFRLLSTEPMCSGCMDYLVMEAEPIKVPIASASERGLCAHIAP